MAQVSPWQSPGHSNPNLLKNWDFRQVVNQRGQSKYTSNQYTIDMWYLYTDCGGTIKLGNNKIILSSPNNGFTQLSQYMEHKLETGRSYTVSFAIDDTIYVMQITGGRSTAIGIVAETKFHYDDENNRILVSVDGNTANIQAVKLEVGTVSTLAIDLRNPPNYAVQLRECQRYLQVFKGALGVATNSSLRNGWLTNIALMQNMRINPTATVTTHIGLRNKDVYTSLVEPFVYNGWDERQGVYSVWSKTVDKLEVDVADIFVANNGMLILSAEL